LLYSALVMPFLWYLEPALIALGQKPELAALASDYIRIAQWGMFPALMMMALRSFFAARSRAGIVLWSALIGTLVNGVLNYALIFGHFGAPEMGVRGAAVASVVSSTVIFLIMAGWAVLHPRHLEYRLFQRFWRPEWPAFFEVFRLGLPIGFTILAEVGLFMAASVMMGWLGTVPLAAHGIAIQLASISFMIPLGLSHAATVRVGQAYGRGDLDSLARARTPSWVWRWRFPSPPRCCSGWRRVADRAVYRRNQCGRGRSCLRLRCRCFWSPLRFRWLTPSR
jgi:MATE family multidrug resistance protein